MGRNQARGNLGVHARVHDLIPTDATPAIFWITNPQNRHVNNVAVGGNFGFWYSLPDVATGSSYADFVDSTTIRPRLQVRPLVRGAPRVWCDMMWGDVL